jgi:amyloid beta precursor protein binding protein 1
MHNIASFMGGVASQECLKVITSQYLPLNNTLIFDGLKSSCVVAAL